MNFPNQASFTNRTEPSDAFAALFPAVYEAGLRAIESGYPAQWCQFGHHVAGHPLLSRAAIAKLVQKLPDHRSGNDEQGAVSCISDVLDGNSSGQSSVWLRDIDREPQYDALMREVLGEIKPIVVDATGAMMQPEASLVIAPQHSVSNPKFDPVHTVHFQLAGSRSISHFSVIPDRSLSDADYEQALTAAFAGALSNQEQDGQPSGASRQSVIRREVAPGEALYAPAFAPYFVRTHEDVSISLALSWRSRWSIHYDGACRFNERLRAMGVKPNPVRAYPLDNRAKSLGWRVLRHWDRLRVTARQ